MRSLPRPGTFRKLTDFATDAGAGLVFIRGRRRVGKTWLLQELEQNLGAACFRLVCRRHSRDSVVLREYVQEWIKVSGRNGLGQIKASALTWKLLFADIGDYAKVYRQNRGQSFVLIIDEVQWLSTGYGESAGIVKAAWDEWIKDDALRVMLCGSSSRFFTEQFGEGSVLRGIQTRATIHVRPFPLATLWHYAVPEWSLTEAVLAYMCLGGIPYYWQRIPSKKGFRRAMNEVCCTSESIMLDEWREIIATEFRTDAVESLNRLFPALMSFEEGITLSQLADRLGMAPTSVARLLEKLTSYGYVLQIIPEAEASQATVKRGKITRGHRYMLSDFYLYFYFSVLRPIEHEIRNNSSGMIFPAQVLQGESKEYIPGFTGKAFERFVFHHIDVALRDGETLSDTGDIKKSRLWKLLDLPDVNYDVKWNVLIRGHSSDQIHSQIDILLIHEKERSVRVIECKWKQTGEKSDVKDVLAKVLPRRYQEYVRRNYLAVSYAPTKQLLDAAKQDNVTIISLEAFV